ncbi:uncharacterized protein ACOB8E_009334 [Sarcophilus harrisii]
MRKLRQTGSSEFPRVIQLLSEISSALYSFCYPTALIILLTVRKQTGFVDFTQNHRAIYSMVPPPFLQDGPWILLISILSLFRSSDTMLNSGDTKKRQETIPGLKELEQWHKYKEDVVLALKKFTIH